MRFVVKRAVATPLASVVTFVAESVPKSAENVTVTPGKMFPDVSSGRASRSAEPPIAGRFCGDADSRRRSTAAVPTLRFSNLPDAPPENAVIVAVPL